MLYRWHGFSTQDQVIDVTMQFHQSARAERAESLTAIEGNYDSRSIEREEENVPKISIQRLVGI